MSESFLNGRVQLLAGDCLELLGRLEENSVDSCVTDPPYGLQFMGREWDKLWRNGTEADTAYVEKTVGKLTSRARKLPDYSASNPQQMQAWHEQWARAVLRVLKPGGHLLAFSATRTYHRMACAIEDAGFEVRDMCSWVFGSGFPKSHDVSKAIDKDAGHWRGRAGAVVIEEQVAKGKEYERTDKGDPITPEAAARQGWGTALKPALEPICMARKPLIGTVAANVLVHGTGAINIDGCRVEAVPGDKGEWPITQRRHDDVAFTLQPVATDQSKGRWPANVIHDGSEEVVGAFPESGPSSDRPRHNGDFKSEAKGYEYAHTSYGHSDAGGSAARFFYQAKQDDPCHSIKSASDAEQTFELQSDHVVSVLSNAVAQSMPRLALHNQSYRAQNTTVSERQLRIVCESVIEAIQRLERRCLLGLEQESITARLGPVICVATRKQTGTTTIILSLWKSARSVEVATFDITETSLEAGGQGFGKRLHYTAKADADDRLGSKHPTVKPLDLMQYLVRLVTPPGGLILDLFAGTGTTGEAAFREGMRAILIEREEEYLADIRRRMALVLAGPDERARESIKAKLQGKPIDNGPLFAKADDYDAVDDLWKSEAVCREAIRERMAAGGRGWEPK